MNPAVITLLLAMALPGDFQSAPPVAPQTATIRPSRPQAATYYTTDYLIAYSRALTRQQTTASQTIQTAGGNGRRGFFGRR
jgi:hypothetical protein